MRVIAGKYRSRPLRSLRGMDIRPTSDCLRETLFNVLSAGNPEALAGTVWLDLFAGTGAVGIEAMSRGAKEVHFVDNSSAAAQAIRGIRTDGPMAPDIPLDGQREAEYVFDKNVAQKLSDIRRSEAEEKARKKAPAAL